MTKNKIKKLITLSYKNNNLDKSNVGKIEKYLKRSELKQYIKALINEERKRTIQINIPKKISEQEKKNFSKTFKNKKLVFNIDPSLIMGVKIVDNDQVYNVTLQEVLKNMVNHISNL